MNDERRPLRRRPTATRPLRTNGSNRDPRIIRAVDALEDGDAGFALQLLELVLADQGEALDGRCHCGRWPGERWDCAPCFDELRRAA